MISHLTLLHVISCPCDVAFDSGQLSMQHYLFCLLTFTYTCVDLCMPFANNRLILFNSAKAVLHLFINIYLHLCGLVHAFC